ncbi:hypothetical protein AUJ14_02145 [Candidatus Micrarchaeota archaeon CG1_02_55_22]|nr:MAG: hypothetical protein AUJ14_02145 [Candidatus Micrarchaeota archaeon CG1_02_55_22]
MVLQLVAGLALIAFAGYALSLALLGRNTELPERVVVAALLGVGVPALALLGLQHVGVRVNDYAIVAGTFIVIGAAGLAYYKLKK